MDDQMICVGSDLCEELAGSEDTSFSLTYGGDPPSRTIARTDRLRLIADMSPLSIGHLLLLPLSHYLSFAQVVRDMPDELDAFVGRIIPAYVNTFGMITIMEHGSSVDTNAACITHAHWHMLPIDGTRVAEILAGDGLIPTELRGHGDLKGLSDAEHSYYYIFDGTVHSLYGVGKKMRSQYLRSIAGYVIGIEDPLWDYSVLVRVELMRKTMQMVRAWNL